MTHASVLSLLAFLSLRACDGIREIMLDDASELGDLISVDGESDDTEAAQEFWVTCPGGMTTRKLENSIDQCEYSKLDLWVAKEPLLRETSEHHELFDFHSDAPLFFNKKSTSINVSHAFVSEFFDALQDNDTRYTLLNDFGMNELANNVTLEREFQAWLGNISQTDFEDSTGDFWSGLHAFENNWLPMVFIVEKSAEHLILGEAIVLLHALEYAAAHGVVIGEAWLASLGINLAGSLLILEHGLHFLLHGVLTPLLVVESFMLVQKFHNLWLEETDQAEDFVMRLVLRGDCVIQRTSLTVHNIDEAELNPIIPEVCGANHSSTLSNLMIRTHKVLDNFFLTLADLGKCMNPGPDSKVDGIRKAKVVCAKRLYRDLREMRHFPGQLWTAMTFISMVMKLTDDLLVTPHYGDILETKFGISPPKDESLESFNEMKDIEAVRNSTDFNKKFTTCYATICTHRAFEMTISRIEQSTRVWMQTFARRKTASNLYGASWKPCQKIFYKLEDTEGDSGDVSVQAVRSSQVRSVCKTEKVYWTPAEEEEEKIPCSSPRNYPQWRCHERTRFQDALWCKHAGTWQGFEYRDVGEDTSVCGSCGSQCCKRANVATSLWPELEGGGH